jgi:hypothetical protein
MSKKTTANFVLVLSGVSEPDSRLEDGLYEAGCDDATLAFRNGVPYLEFDREAGSLEKAVLSAVRDTERADPRIKVVRVEPGDLVNASEIARRIGCTREYVRLLTQGKRGKGEFPTPHSGITSKALVWSWADVVRWLYEHKVIEDRTILDAAEIVRDINDALEVRENPAIIDRRLKYLRELGGRKSTAPDVA